LINPYSSSGGHDAYKETIDSSRVSNIQNQVLEGSQKPGSRKMWLSARKNSFNDRFSAYSDNLRIDRIDRMMRPNSNAEKNWLHLKRNSLMRSALKQTPSQIDLQLSIDY
jgi:hypothetical protein